jgi:hypothetical protein
MSFVASDAPSARAKLLSMFRYYLKRWELTQDGDPLFTPTSRLLPVHCASGPAMLKIAVTEEERRGGQLMQWWDGQGAARVLACDDRAVLLERAEGAISLADMVSRSRDEEASRTICAVLAKLHRPRSRLPPTLVSLSEWFPPLEQVAAARQGIFRVAATTPQPCWRRNRMSECFTETCTTAMCSILAPADGCQSIPKDSSATGTSTMQTSFAIPTKRPPACLVA